MSTGKGPWKLAGVYTEAEETETGLLEARTPLQGDMDATALSKSQWVWNCSLAPQRPSLRDCLVQNIPTAPLP